MTQESFVDYYEVLQVSSSAEPAVIEAAFKKLAQLYHPDVNHNSDASVKMKCINVAHDILSDSFKRKEFDKILSQRASKAGAKQSFCSPSPITEPCSIELNDCIPGRTIKASFVLFNTGGSFSKIKITPSQPWLNVESWQSLSKSDELPLKINIVASGSDWNSKYIGQIQVSLDNARNSFLVVLITRMRLDICDHIWHDIDFCYLKPWVKAKKGTLDTGVLLRGKAFRYRLNLNTGKYQMRLSSTIPSALYYPYD